MSRFVLVITMMAIISGTVATSSPLCYSNRCMTSTRLGCVMDPDQDTPSDQICCAGSKCVPIYIPASDTSASHNTTICASDYNAADHSRFTEPTKGLPIPPVMLDVWSAKAVYYNQSNGDTGWGEFYYDAASYDKPALRVDFYPMCPFLQLFEQGVDSNYVGCSVLWKDGINYYIYPKRKTCCKYDFPVWYPEWMCQSNATYMVEYDLAIVLNN
eukprot:TRINITY_DN2989_c1_g1_i2.p1 TRINITY_DN2989_c1_g1~~TRINITY_DN2989_c1_g1_i2.p1  ORF type:complete len:214 (-),score=36.21 TRINITY_DN2989_c1_g1_i2:23-664(-)